jgi:hypothetical protein
VLLRSVELSQENVFEADGSLEDKREILARPVDDVAF